MSEICGRKKMGEYNMLQCYRSKGHDGECVYGIENKDATIAALSEELKKYKAFWEWARETDKMIFIREYECGRER